MEIVSKANGIMEVGVDGQSNHEAITVPDRNHFVVYA